MPGSVRSLSILILVVVGTWRCAVQPNFRIIAIFGNLLNIISYGIHVWSAIYVVLLCRYAGWFTASPRYLLSSPDSFSIDSTFSSSMQCIRPDSSLVCRLYGDDVVRTIPFRLNSFCITKNSLAISEWTLFTLHFVYHYNYEGWSEHNFAASSILFCGTETAYCCSIVVIVSKHRHFLYVTTSNASHISRCSVISSAFRINFPDNGAFVCSQ